MASSTSCSTVASWPQPVAHGAGWAPIGLPPPLPLNPHAHLPSGMGLPSILWKVSAGLAASPFFLFLGVVIS